MKQHHIICPLINFQIQWGMLRSKHDRTKEETISIFKERQKKVIDGIDLFNGIKIRLFTQQDIKDIDSGPFTPFTGLREHISTRTYLLEKNIEAEEKQTGETEKQMRNIVLALRLLKEGHVYGDDVFCFNLEKGHFTSWSREGAPPTQDRIGFGYGLNFEDFSDLKKIIDKVQKIDFNKRKSFDLACKRFQRAYQEYDLDDRLVDYMIAFVALFLKGEKQGSSQGKIIAIACASLLGKNEEEREEIKKDLITAYSMRNCIVHGSEYQKTLDRFEIIEIIDNYLRDSIIKFLD